jgi:hypothetical protein
MNIERLKYLSEQRLVELKDSVEANLARYSGGNFLDLAAQNGWAIEHDLTVDLSPLRDLSAEMGAEAEIANSLLVQQALRGLSPALAMEERIWVRLTHLEGLEFCRKRWLHASDTQGQIKEIITHFFAGSQTVVRDDNGISRLWWNAYVAQLAIPSDPKAALQLILRKADFRSNFIERTRTVSRPALAAGIVRAMQNDPWVTSTEGSYRVFMRTLNKLGGGRLFEIMGADAIDRFVAECIGIARAELVVE